MEKIVAEISGRVIEKEHLIKFKNMIADQDQLKVYFLALHTALLSAHLKIVDLHGCWTVSIFASPY